jgi:hypothetical protein
VSALPAVAKRTRLGRRLPWVAIVVLVAGVVSTGAEPAASASVRVTVTAGKPNDFGFKLVPKAVKHGEVSSR